MANVNIRVRPDTGALALDFYYRSVRCREQTALRDTPDNRKRVQALANRIQREIERGTFDYTAHFPNSPRAAQFQASGTVARAPAGIAAPGAPMVAGATTPVSLDRQTPSFAEFAEQWFLEMSPQWRRSHRTGVREVLDKNLLPHFGARALHQITKADVLAFRADLARQPGRKGPTLGAARVNKVMCFLRQILNEAADRHDFVPAFRGIRPLKQKRTDVQPFSLDEVHRILATVRPDYRDYLTVRFFTGMRTGEINGLKWKYVDLERKLILVRESIVGGEEEESLKTETSHRDIPMLPIVRSAIEARMKERQPGCPFVFPTSEGNPINANNFSNRVWYPLLRYLELEPRRPYQTRHTAATLMLAAGENPEWIAQVMGHSTTAMLFKVYSRFVPNLTRQDGRAFAGLVHSRLAPNAKDAPTPAAEPADALTILRELPADRLAELLALAGQANPSGSSR
jgi:integrase